MGFAPEGADVDRNTCDFLEIPVPNPAQADFGTGHLRMCWHTTGSHRNSGFRCGLAAPFDTTYERLDPHRLSPLICHSAGAAL